MWFWYSSSDDIYFRWVNSSITIQTRLLSVWSRRGGRTQSEDTRVRDVWWSARRLSFSWLKILWCSWEFFLNLISLLMLISFSSYRHMLLFHQLTWCWWFNMGLRLVVVICGVGLGIEEEEERQQEEWWWGKNSFSHLSLLHVLIIIWFFFFLSPIVYFMMLFNVNFILFSAVPLLLFFGSFMIQQFFSLLWTFCC